MNTTVRLDKAGRVVIPKRLRDELHLEAGDRMDLESAGESFTLRPVRSVSPLRSKHGVRVFRGNERLTAAATDQVLFALRDGRDVANRGART